MGTDDTAHTGGDDSGSGLAAWKWITIVLIAAAQGAVELRYSGSNATAIGGFLGSLLVLFFIAHFSNGAFTDSLIYNSSYKYASMLAGAASIFVGLLAGNGFAAYVLLMAVIYPPAAGLTWAGRHLSSQTNATSR
jgi:hypothetical protein